MVDEQWTRAMEYVNSVSELNYMTQIVIMLYEDPTKVRIYLPHPVLFSDGRVVQSDFRVFFNSIAFHGNPISELWSIICHMGSHSVTCHLTWVTVTHLNSSQSGQFTMCVVYILIASSVFSSSAFHLYRIIQGTKLLLAVDDDSKSVQHPVTLRQFTEADQQFVIQLFVCYLQ